MKSVRRARRGDPLHNGERRVLELMAAGARLDETLDALCRTIDDESRLMASVFLLEHNDTRFRCAAAPHIPAVWRRALSSVDAAAAPACSAAARDGVRVVVPDMRVDPRFAPFRRPLLAARLRSVISTPFFSSNRRVLGTFAVYGRRPGKPTARQLRLIDRATHLASIAVERHVTEAGLYESNERFRQIADHVREVFWVCAADFSAMLYVSPGYETAFGESCESLYQNPRSWVEAIHKDDRTRVTSLIERDRNREFEVEYRIVRRDGSIRWIWDRGFPIRDAEGATYRVAGIAEDITDRRQTAEHLRRSERLLAEAQRLSHIGSWIWDINAGTVTWSEELFRIFGVEPGGLVPGRDAMPMVDPEDHGRVRHTFDEAIRTRAPFEMHYRVRRPDGEERHLQSRGFLVRDESGNPSSIFGTTQDLTERIRAEEALRQSERLLRQVLDALPVGVAVMNPGGNIVLNNPASNQIWANVIEAGSERYAKTRAWWLHSGEPLAPDEWASARALRTGETSLNEVIEIEAFDGTRKIIQNSAVPIRDSGQAIVGAVVINEDISARKATERELRASASQMRVLATRLMHAQDEERRRIARLLHETTAQDLAGLKMLLARLGRASDRLSDADRDLLSESLTLVEESMRGARTLSYLLHPPLLDEEGLLSAIRWYVEGFATRSGIKVDLELPEEFARLPLDVETTLFRVVQEALINIHRHAMSPSARVTLRLQGHQLLLEISDRGRGMPADLVARLTGTGGALGVGVVGMRERLKQLDGRLEIESSSSGTTVRAVIPMPSETA